MLDTVDVDRGELQSKWAVERLSLSPHIDKDPAMVRAASLDQNPCNVAFVAASAYDLPFPCDCIESVVALGLLAYITDAKRLLGEFRRVLRKAGTVMLTDSVNRSQEPVLLAAKALEFVLVEDAEGHCPAASGTIKRRRLLVLESR